MDREQRARAAFDAYGGTPYSWKQNGCREAWTKGVEWLENRPSNGASPGERFHWCLAKFLGSGQLGDWRKFSTAEQDHWAHLASFLQPHRSYQ